MASVYLRFVPPDVDDLIIMRIFEGTDPLAQFQLIETVTDIGTFPTYIDNYTTTFAQLVSDYFAIEFIDNKGASSGLSIPVKGDSLLAISEIQQRVLERDNTLNEHVALQETESALQYAFPQYDPYDPTLQLDYVQKRGMTNLTLAMCYLTELARAPGMSWTAGIVSLKISDQALKLRADSIDKLVKRANRDLGLDFSMIAYLQDIDIAGGNFLTVTTVDTSRLLVEQTRFQLATTIVEVPPFVIDGPSSS